MRGKRDSLEIFVKGVSVEIRGNNVKVVGYYGFVFEFLGWWVDVKSKGMFIKIREIYWEDLI